MKGGMKNSNVGKPGAYIEPKGSKGGGKVSEMVSKNAPMTNLRARQAVPGGNALDGKMK